ncbi:carbon-nitrogen hydrolase family protein [Micromonospora sp. WMMC241]|uniref:nitrilase-related carbon-nitrogen hydrolase n=1 Tax=Micromonospora sp. WMMC241 TaxID=3015159 RepID=UPI0022B6A6A3|nr:nitrilase-related carbon-nitrogen hydrolase [Micromonospora sp. WMMC241]MCZ7438030.1 carbon-nitrogen hydrolase family protein [Micromonospora sp. WMMC241]
MRTPLRIAVAQPLTLAHDVAGNAARHAAAVRAAGARVVVFPELSLTGYELAAAPLDPADDRLAPLRAACAETGTLALAGAPVAGPHIAVLAVDGEGVRVAYRKMWLGGAEPQRFRPGREPAVLTVDGWRLGLAVCRDTGVPAHAAATVAAGADGYLAGVLESADDAAVPAERARRITAAHGVWVATASFAGSTGGGYARAAGGSGVWSPAGVVVARAGAATGELVTATLH